MFPVDPLWIYILVPAALISILILIRLKQEKMAKQVGNEFFEEEEEEVVRPREKKTARKGVDEIREAPSEPELSKEKGSQECPHYLGYLYMKKGPDRTYIPNECYGCRKLLQCLYSPDVIEKVYGK